MIDAAKLNQMIKKGGIGYVVQAKLLQEEEIPI